MVDLIKELIYKINPVFRKLTIIPVDTINQDSDKDSFTMEQVIEARLKGDQQAVVIYGYDCPGVAARRQYGSLLNSEGVFYIQIPALLDQVYPILEAALKYKVKKKKKKELQGAEYEYGIKIIRAYRHRCDNLWMSMQSSLSRQAVTGKNKGKVTVKRLINGPYIEKFSKEYDEKIEEIVIRIGLKKAKQIPALFGDVIKRTGKIYNMKDTPVSKKILEEISICIRKIRAISEILSAAKELDERA